MGKTKDLGHLANIIAYDASNNVTVPATLTMNSNQLVASQSYVTTQLSSYALTSALSSYIPTSRTITINGTTYDLSANRSWTITSMIYPTAGISLSTGTAWGTSITDNSANWNTAFGWGNHAVQSYATQSYVTAQVASLVSSAPAALDTLNELAAALGNDASFSTTVSTSLGNRLRIDIATQGLTATQQGYGRTNLALGTAALSAIGDFAAALSGTGFVKASGTVISYDNSTYLTTASAASTYQTILSNPILGTGTRTASYLPRFSATNTIENSTISEGEGFVQINNDLIAGYPEFRYNKALYARFRITTNLVNDNIGIAFGESSTGVDYANIVATIIDKTGSNFKGKLTLQVRNGNNSYSYALTLVDTGAATFISSVTATSFIGSGSGLTGTASSLTAGTASSVAWTSVTSKPTALSQFSNDLGNYGGWITSSGSISGTSSNITSYTINQSVGSSNSPSFAGLTINTGGSGTWAPFIVTSTSLWGDGATQYVTIGAGGAAGIMIYNPHIVWNSNENIAGIKMGRSGGISSGSYYVMGTGASDNFLITKNGSISTPQFNINSSGNATFSGTLSGSNLSGTNTGDQTSISGNAASSTYSSAVYLGGNSSYAITNSSWAGTGGYHGYSYTGGNFRFGFSSTGGYIDVYTDGNFYAGIDLNGINNLVLHTGNYTSYSPSLTGSGASGTWGISISGNSTTVGGYSVSGSVGANTVVIRDVNNYVYFNYINSNVSETENPTIGSFYTSNGDGWLRKASIAHVKNQIGLASAAYQSSTYFFSTTSMYADRNIVASTNLDTDLENGGAFGSYGAGGTGWNAPFSYGAVMAFAFTSGIKAQFGFDIRHNQSDYGDLQYRTKNNLGYSTWRTMWHSGNLTNLSQLTNGPGYITSSSSISGNAATASSAQSNTFNITGTSPTIAFIDTDDGATRYVHHNGGAIGFLDSGGGWTLRCANGAAQFYGTVIATNLSGTNTGDQTSISGNAATSSNTSSISSAVGTAYIWTGIQQFQTNNGTSAVNNSYSAALQAFSTGGNSAFMSFHRASYYAINFGLDSDNVMRIGGWSASSNRLQMDMSGNLTMAGDITAYSDARVKTNIKTIENALSKTLALRGVSYNRTDSEDIRTKIGVIAQETLLIVPEVVNQDNDGMYNVSYGNMAALFIEAIKEQQQQIEELKTIINGITK